MRGMMGLMIGAMFVGVATGGSSAQMPPTAQVETLTPAAPPVLALRARADTRDAILKQRLETIVPRLMRDAGIDMWILVAREYLEDPVVATMLDARSMRARRRTILIFVDPGDGKPVERLTVSRYGLGDLFAGAWNPEKQPDQWARVGEIVAERAPRRIALDVSADSAFADGLTTSQHDALLAAIPAAYRPRIVPADDLAIGWLETRTAAEMALYPGIVAIAHGIIAQALSDKVITPGTTTADDVVWWMRERIAERRLATWFHPSIAIFRQGATALEGDAVIQPGDMLWTDFGITYLGLNTDTQHLAYVLKPGERDAPAGLKAGLAAANAVQDALTTSFATGLSGNAVLENARARAMAAGLRPTIYSHPIGYHGHGAGPAIGFWDDQAASPRGARAIVPNTAWSIELNAVAKVPEWGGQEVPFRLEEDAFFDGRSVRYIDGRQTRFHLIGAR